MKKYLKYGGIVCAMVIAGTLSGCGEHGKLDVSNSLTSLNNQPFSKVIAMYGLPDEKDVGLTENTSTFIYRHDVDRSKSSMFVQKAHSVHSFCQISFDVDDNSNLVLSSEVVGDDQSCSKLYHKKN